MQEFTEQFRQLIESAEEKLSAISEQDSLKSSAPGKWTCREILGHLIDSSINNARRFITGQSMTELIFDGYDQNIWVSSQKYNEQPWPELIATWRQANLHIVNLTRAIPADVLNRSHDVHNLDKIAWQKIPRDQLVTLAYVITDYFGHMIYHINHILDLQGMEKMPTH